MIKCLFHRVRSNDRRVFVIAMVMLSWAWIGAAHVSAADESADDFVVVSRETSPEVKFSLEKVKDDLRVTVAVAPRERQLPPAQVTLGIAAVSKVVASSESQRGVARVQDASGATRYTFSVPANQLIKNESDWDRLRVAFAVRWPGGPGGADVQRERFRCTDGRAAHADLPNDIAYWAPLSLAEHQAATAERRLRIMVRVTQPMEGKLTVVIDSAEGRRVRNLVSGQSVSKGEINLVWDGLDDNGNVVPPGAYRWRAASHPGITPHHQFSYYNDGTPPWRSSDPASGWLSDHTNPMIATAIGERIFIGSILSEAGNTVIQLTPDGKKIGDTNKPAQIGYGASFLAADEKHLYAFYEGYSGYADSMKDLGNGKWECLRPSTVLRYDMAGKLVPYRKEGAERVLAGNPYQGQDARKGARRRPPLPDNLGGAVVLDGKLYASLRQENRILVLDPATGESTGQIKLDQPGFLAGHAGNLFALSGETVVRIDPKTASVTKLFPLVLSAAMQYPPGNDDMGLDSKTARLATGLAMSAAGEIFVSDNGVDQNVKVFDVSGKLLREIGRKGGRPLNGAWNPDGMYQPHGIAIDGTGQLWVTETDVQPRRISVWNAATGAFVREHLGPSRYGSPGGSFDHADGRRWIGGGVLWNLDIASKTAEPVSTLYHPTKPGQVDDELPSTSYQFAYRDGRTFLTGQGRYTSVYELRPDNTLKLWAICGPLSALAQTPRWTLPKGLAEVPALKVIFEGDDPGGEVTGQFKDRVKVNETQLKKVGSVLWVDRDGDDIIEPDEVEVSSLTRTIMGPYWGSANPSLDLRLPARIDGALSAVTLSPRGFLPSGAPDYRLIESIDAAQKIVPPTGVSISDTHSTIQDRFGRMLLNSTPMAGVDSEGKVAWTFPNKWTSVHGSHNAPLPESGVLQGALWFLGTAALDKEGEVTVINGNHGRFFVMTTDGLYLDEMFKDVRVTQQRDAYHIGGEPFGGFFGRNDVDGNYYLQSGHTDYRIFRIDGFKELRRESGALNVTGEQLAAAARNMERVAAAGQTSKSMTVAELSKTTALDPNPDKWPGTWSIQWGDARRSFPFAEVRVVRQADQLHLAYRVRDPSPWVNNGSDWTMLFKTGDSVNFEFSTDASARLDRMSPVRGDKRLLIGPIAKDNVAVLYDYRGGAGTGEPVRFSSPWRAEPVDRVTKLDNAKLNVRRIQGGYVLTASIPLADLGLPATGSAALKGDFGVIYGDEAGSINVLRSYWSNQSTALVSDVPGEIQINPRLWGTMRFEEAK